MAHYLTYGMVYLGASLMIYNIYGFITFARRIRSRTSWDDGKAILYVPILLLLLFLLGYLLAGQWGRLDLIISSILFGGSIFVFVMYLLLNSITNKIIESEQREVELKAAEESSREKNEILAAISHEMRTPVASIEGYLGLAMNPSTATVDDRGMDYLKKAHEASQHLGRLFQDLLDTTKLDDGQMKPQLEPVDIVALVKSIADGQIPNITAKGLGYQFGSGSVDQQLSGGKRIDQLIYASVDKDFLHEVLNNLIENAIKYTPAGWVTVNVRADNYNVQIIVEDTGIGVARSELSHIFQKFYRVDNRDTREIGGTGLGLYLVQQRVEAMNGRVWAESELGKGTRFIVMLPRIGEEAYRQQRFYLDNQQAQGLENIDF